MTPLEDEWLADYLAMLAETARRTGIDVSVVQRVLDVFREVAEERARERENSKFAPNVGGASVHSALSWCFWIVVTIMPECVAAQEVIGRRLFSDQLVISEPFVEDELSLPSIMHIRRPATDREAPRALATQVGGEFKKRLTSNLEGSVSGGLTLLNRAGAPSLAGFDNLSLGLKYQFLRSPTGEAVASVALDWEVGGTGRTATGAESFDTISPAILFGKGFGDLPDVLAGFKPFALAGLLGAGLPTRAHTWTFSENEVMIVPHPDLLKWGVVIEYSLFYLQSHVRDLGLPVPLDRMVPLAELDFQTAVDRGAAGRTVGTANVGVVWVGTSVQIGVEAVVPVNERSGKNVGVRAFLRIGLDELFGGRLGRPLFGGPD